MRRPRPPLTAVLRGAFLALAFPVILSAADADPPVELPAAGELALSTLPLDIATASFYELAAWARSLGLDDSGSVESLRSRIAEHFGVTMPRAAGEGGRRVVIERAAEAEYFEVDEEADGIVRLGGGVSLVVSDEEKGETHRLEAREILYDRARNSVSARGAVRYRRESAEGFEEFAGEILEADLDDWSGIFVDGILLRPGGGSDGRTGVSAGTKGLRAFSFSGESILRRAGDLVLLDRAIVSSCDLEEPHYSLRASRMWLLGPGEWAIADALLYLGRVPVLWLPFFYYPSEEIVFHPVIGYRSREGRFVQTTTYLIGKKPASSTTGFLSGLAPAKDGPKELKGFFLRSVPEDGEKGLSGRGMLKLLVDIYSGLGAFAALEGTVPAGSTVEKLEYSLGLGLSRSLFALPDGTWTASVAEEDWKSVWNDSRLLGTQLPFRFGLNVSTTLSIGKLRLTGELPLYSDPSWDRDFRARSEDMDWLGISGEKVETIPGKRSSFTQKVGLALSLSPKALQPWLSSIDLSRLQVSLGWLSRVGANVDGQPAASFAVDPAREFFYPDVLKPFDLALAFRGNLLRSSPGAGRSAPDGTRAHATEAGAPLRAPWEAAVPEEEPPPSGQESEGIDESGLEPAFRRPLPAPSWTPPSTAATGSPSWSLDWSLSPTVLLEDRLLSDSWTSPEDIDFSSMFYRLRSWKLGASLSGNLAWSGFQGNLGLNWADQAQDREAVEDQTYAVRVAQLRLADYKATSSKLAGSLKLSARPFPAIPLLAPSSLSWSLDSTLYGRSFDTLAGDEPTWKVLYPAWEKETITRHEAGATLALVLGGRTQSLGFTLGFPPLTESWAAALSLDAGIGELGARLQSGLRASRPEGASDFIFDPVSTSLSLKGPAGLTLSDTLSWDVEKSRPISNLARLAWGDLSVSFTARRAIPQEPVIGTGWVPAGEEAFLPQSLETSFRRTWKTDAGLKDSFSFTLSGSYSQSLLRFTESTLGFGLGGSVSLGSGISLTISSFSQNKAAWRYWPGIFPAVAGLGLPDDGWVNPALDILNSFAFSDLGRREESLFKLRSLALSLRQDLHDWDLTVGVQAAPLYDSASKTYSIDSTITIGIVWRDIPPLKANLVRNKEAWTY